MTELRRAAEWLVPGASVVAGVGGYVLARPRLPRPMAIDWDAAGSAIAAAPHPQFVLTLLFPLVVAGIGGIAYAHRSTRGGHARLVVTASHVGSALMAGIALDQLAANLDAASWEQAVRESRVGVVLVTGLLAGVIGWLLAGGRTEPVARRRAPRTLPVVDSELTVWSGTASLPWRSRVSGFAAVAFALAFVAMTGWSAIGVVVVPLVMLLVSLRVRVTVGPGGLRVAFGWFPWPRIDVPLHEIERLEIEEVDPTQYGGFGHRLIARTRAIVLRPGEAIRVSRRGRADVLVTVEGAARAAGVLAGHLERLSRL